MNNIVCPNCEEYELIGYEITPNDEFIAHDGSMREEMIVNACCYNCETEFSIYYVYDHTSINAENSEVAR